MNPQRMGGVIMLVAGVVLLMIGLNASDSIADRWSNFFTGHYTDETVWFMIGGGGLAIIGLIMAIGGGRGART